MAKIAVEKVPGTPSRPRDAERKCRKLIEKVTTAGSLETGMRFSWRMEWHKHSLTGAAIRARAPSELAGTAITAKAVHVWELKPESGNQTLLAMKESMDRPLMAKLYPPRELAEVGNECLLALKRAAEQRP